MSTDYYQNGKLRTVVTVNLKSAKLDTSGGNWSNTPTSPVTKNSDYADIFKCINVGSSICGPEGWVEHEASDGSIFSMHFDCPVSSKNICDASVSGGSPFTISGSVPGSGADIDYKWDITQKVYDTFVDMPVLSIDLLNAPKCDLIPIEKILEYIANRKYIRLRDVFDVPELSPEAKIWCAMQRIFLTPQSKAILTRDLVEMIMTGVKSIRFVFAHEGGTFVLRSALPCAALPMLSDDISARHGITGTWAELAEPVD